jgi:predicted neuraminidase
VRNGYTIRGMQAPNHGPIRITTECIFQSSPSHSCHASTIAETYTGLVAAWFAGTGEGCPDVAIWLSRWRMTAGWSSPKEVANGLQVDGTRYPCWNPVLFQYPHGDLVLFYKVGPSPQEWWGMVMNSSDGGLTWSQPIQLPGKVIGPVKNKPVLIDSNLLLCPSSTEIGGKWQAHLDLTCDGGLTWSSIGPLNDPKQFAVIQPTILVHSRKKIQILCRSKQQRIAEAWSEDGGVSWQPMHLTRLPNPDSGIDAARLQDGRTLLVYNPTTRGRTPLSVAVSEDGCQWREILTLEDQRGEYSYPAVIQSKDGLVHITYTWKRRRIKHVILEPGML